MWELLKGVLGEKVSGISKIQKVIQKDGKVRFDVQISASGDDHEIVDVEYGWGFGYR